MAMYKSFLLEQTNAAGYQVPVTNPTAVELWSTGGGAAKLKELGSGITNNNDGTYQIEISDLATGVYQIKVDFGSGLTEPDELNLIKIEGYDTLTQADVDAVTLEYSGNLHVKVDGIDKTRIAADVAGVGLKQNVDGSLEADIDDAAGNGATTKLYSADKIFDELALKTDQTAIGDRNYTDENVVTDAESLTASINALDMAIGDMNFSGISLLNALWEHGLASVTNAFKALNAQIMSNLKAITNGTDIYNHRIVYSSTNEQTDAGNLAPAKTFIETSNIYQYKLQGSFYKMDGDKYLKLYCKKSNSDASKTTSIRFVSSSGNIIDEELEYADVSWHDVGLVLDISTYANGLHTWSIGLKTSAGTGEVASMTWVNVEVTGA